MLGKEPHFFLPTFPLPRVSLLISALLEGSSSHTILLSSATAPSGACGFVCFFLFYSVGQLMFFTCWNLTLPSCKACGIGLVRSRDPFLTKGGSLEEKKKGGAPPFPGVNSCLTNLVCTGVDTRCSQMKKREMTHRGSRGSCCNVPRERFFFLKKKEGGHCRTILGNRT